MKRLTLALCLLLATPVLAVEPDEILDDPELEARARALSTGLRCPVCQNESIDESNATVSKDLRLLLRDRLVAGDSDAEAVQYLVDRYGEYILLNPTTDGANKVLWAAPAAMLGLALLAGGITVMRARRARGPDGLTPEEQARLDELMKP
ncbi:MAG: cytochrome c-type biogenesis protein CcmH [Rhodobacteraceae bacterium HLUCCA08]|nr:MAG: cytochrome c-type biogenesis protein CcmH [Rhodobacteraceae bacterium HLUCCA08]